MTLPACALALILLIDTSDSVSDDNYLVQRAGTAEALVSEDVQKAVAVEGGIAIKVVEWAATRHTSVPWTLVEDIDGLRRVAQALNEGGKWRQTSGSTGMTIAVREAINDFQNAPCEAGRRVIDVSGDGENNLHPDGVDYDMQRAMSPQEYVQRVADTVKGERDRAMRLGVTINGLPIMSPVEPKLDEYYANAVVTYDGFVVPAKGFEEFKAAIRRKLAFEIAGKRATSTFALQRKVE